MGAHYSLPIRVYIEDTDAGGIVYYVNYLKFMERARTELLRSLGYAKTAIFSEELMFVVHSTQIKYLSPARLDESLDATATVTKTGRSYMVFAQSVTRDGTLLCEATVKIACVHQQTMHPTRIPQPMLDALAKEH